MQLGGWREWVSVALIVPAAGVFAIWAAHMIGKLARWFGRRTVQNVSRIFAGVVVEWMAPEMAHQSTRVTAAISELRESNSMDHQTTSDRLTAVEERQTEVEASVDNMAVRLGAVEQRLNIRPPDARTRATDKEFPVP